MLRTREVEFRASFELGAVGKVQVDPETGRLNDFTEEQFLQTLRTGRHQGRGRQILPPMPWPFIGKMTDDDLKAIFAYLRQVQPVKNKVPDPLPPAQ